MSNSFPLKSIPLENTSDKYVLEFYYKQLWQHIKSLEEVCQSGLQTDNKIKNDQTERIHDIEKLIEITLRFITTLTVGPSKENITKREFSTFSRGGKLFIGLLYHRTRKMYYIFLLLIIMAILLQTFIFSASFS